MYDNGANIIGMRFETRDLLAGIVVVDPQLEIIAPGNDPILACYEPSCSDGDICEFESFDYCLLIQLALALEKVRG